MPVLRLPSQTQTVTVCWPVANYTGRWYERKCVNNLPIVATQQRSDRQSNPWLPDRQYNDQHNVVTPFRRRRGWKYNDINALSVHASEQYDDQYTYRYDGMLLQVVHWWGDWTGVQPGTGPLPTVPTVAAPVNGQCTNFRLLTITALQKG